VVTSEAVIAELEDGDYPNKSIALALLDGVPVLGVDETVAEIVEAYLRHRLMPQDPLGDALHLALASYYKCDFLLTWNCKHLGICQQVRSSQTSQHHPWIVYSQAGHSA
jgi:hypothetical protein